MTLYIDEELYDLTIIGGGPTGLFAAFYGGLRGCRVKVIDSVPQLGGQLAALYPEKYIYDVAGFPKVKAIDLVNNLIRQNTSFNPGYVLEEQVQAFEKEGEHFKLLSSKGTHFSKAIIITGGVGAFVPRKLEHEKAAVYENQNLFYFIKDLESFRDKKVVVLGGGDSALDWAMMLEPLAKEVSLVHRREEFRAHETSIKQVMDSSINVYTSYGVKDLVGDSQIEKVVITHAKTNEDVTLEAEALIVNYGFVSSLGPIADWGLDLVKRSIMVNSKMETNVPGVYAAGDLVDYPGKVKLIAVGFGEAPIAVNNALAYINPGTRVQPGHSSNLVLSI
jgi:thioredoxin reductase